MYNLEQRISKYLKEAIWFHDYYNIFIHLTNYSINKQNPNYKNNLKDNKEIIENEEVEEDNEQYDDSSKWSLVEYRNYFKKEIAILKKKRNYNNCFISLLFCNLHVKWNYSTIHC